MKKVKEVDGDHTQRVVDKFLLLSDDTVCTRFEGGRSTWTLVVRTLNWDLLNP